MDKSAPISALNANLNVYYVQAILLMNANSALLIFI